MHSLEMGVRHGKWVLVENYPVTIDGALEPLLLQQRFWLGGTEMLHFGDQAVPFNDNFKLFISTRAANPHFPPELCAKVSVLNFCVTPEGLLDQMLTEFVVRN
jgi:dynein heavy chain